MKELINYSSTFFEYKKWRIHGKSAPSEGGSGHNCDLERVMECCINCKNRCLLVLLFLIVV